MNNATEPGGFKNLKVYLQIVFNSLRQCIQRKLLDNLQKRFKLQSQVLETKPVLQSFDIESIKEDTKNVSSDRLVKEGGDVETWIQVSTEETRRDLVRWVMRLYVAWVLIGLIVFVATGNVWLLVTMGVLALPLRKIFAYYFSHRR